ncbi:hypothetical protein [Kineococcus terrestris]|uniref:hypothetical protein n=1 Tax=Kineococcus terrestris TaxID=2044856 RepID=UPI0034DB0E1D
MLDGTGALPTTRPTDLPPGPAGAGPAATGDPHRWLREVLRRGHGPDPVLPWRPVPAQRAGTARDVRDGLLRVLVGDVVVAAGAPLDAATRARALALLVGAGAVVVGPTAAWVHAGAAAGAPQRLWVAGGPRPQVLAARAGLPVERTRCRPARADLLELGGLLVTSPARTLVDVARTAPGRAVRVREALLAACPEGLGPADVREATDGARRRRGVRAARAALGAAAAPA